MLAPSSRLDRLPPITLEMVKRESPDDTYLRRARRANLIYQAGQREALMDLYNPYLASVLLRHANLAVESYQRCIAVREVMNTSVFSDERRDELVSVWQGTPHLEEYKDKRHFPSWPNMSAEQIQSAIRLWWRTEIISADLIQGLKEDIFARSFRNAHEKKVVKAITRRVLESMPMVLQQEVIDTYIQYLVCLAWRESDKDKEPTRKVSLSAHNDNHTGSYTGTSHKTY